jgi:hypothetical protein
MQRPEWPASLLTRACLGLALAFPMTAPGQTPVPPELHDWEAWVLHGHESHRCPWLVPGEPDGAERVCAWPGVLELAADARGARFSMHWEVVTEGWLTLPGDAQHWPEDLKLDGAGALLVQHQGAPAVWATPGAHQVTGTFRWRQRPAVLALPGRIALLNLTLDGKPVALPQRDSSGVTLQMNAASRAEDRLELRVFRLLEDDLPAALTTTVRLAVAGEAREVPLPGVLPLGFVPVSLESPLTARLDPDGTLRVQVRPGNFELTLQARGPSPVSEVQLPHLPAPWPGEEVWSFQPQDRLRVAAPEGAPGTDPAQANVPAAWRQLPAYRLAAGATLRIAERSRGLARADANQLRLYRTAWLDFSGAGYTIQDQLQGEMRQGWRLDMRAPYSLQSARTTEGAALLITQGADAQLTGIEWRAPSLALSALSRVPRTAAALPASGWQTRFVQVSGELVTAPGYRLLAAVGPDSAPEAWLERWRLIDIFGVLLIATAAWRLIGRRAGLLALATLVLSYQEHGAPTWLWLNVLIAFALAHAAPAGRLRQWAQGYRVLGVLLLLLAFIPFAVQQARLALYPQLEALELPDNLTAGSAPVELKSAIVQEVAVPAPAPPAADQALIAPMQSIAVSAARREPAPKAAGYQPGVLLQAGPATPAWRYHTYPFSYSGPVEANATARFIVSPPWLTRLWRVLALALAVLLLRELLGAELPEWRARWPARARAVASVLLFLGLLGALPRAHAASTPEAGVLSELQRRLLAAPACAPDCVDVPAAQVSADAARVQVVLSVSALDSVGVALPAADPNWLPDRIEVDGHAAGAVYRDARGVRFLLLARGPHIVRIEGPVSASELVSLAFVLPPHVIDVTAPDWEVSGLSERRLTNGSLQLTRRRTAGANGEAAATQGEFPPFVTVERNFRLAHEWTIDTEVRRVAPQAGGFSVSLPLLPSEAVTTAGLSAREGTVEVALAPDDNERSFASILPTTGTLELLARPSARYAEHWRFEVAPEWHVSFSGVPAVMPEQPGPVWLFEYYPRPGEHLALTVTRPPVVTGATVAFERVQLQTAVGQRSRDVTLILDYRSTQGGRELVQLPKDANVSLVQSDGEALALRPSEGELSLSALPGAHTWVIQWQRPQGAQLVTRSEPLTLGNSAGNLHLTMTLPQERWILFTSGAGVGPTVLYWSELVVFVLIAWLIGRSGLSPLPLRDWLLLGLGLSSFSWLVLALFAFFVAVFEWRARQGAPHDVRHFRLLQIGLAVLALAALAAVVAAVPRGLLAHPHMRIAGADSGALQWFVDRSSSVLPHAQVLSVSLWWYKLAMLAWALWLSFALIRWIRWAWQVLTREGLWPQPPVPPATAAAVPSA